MILENTSELANAESSLIADEAVKLLIEKKAIDIKLYNVSENSGITDFYINCTGRSSTHVSSLADEVVDNLERRGKTALRVEGRQGNSWLLVDFGSVIINVFDSESRSYYNFDRLLPAESLVDISELVKEVDKKFS